MSLSALVRRINRKLAKEWEAIRRCPPRSRSHDALGDFYRMDTHRNVVIACGVDPVDIARELKVLGEWERVGGVTQ
ncbi:MAG: hypothetical protein JNL10_03190 [Verrucomicrobiales bacterium]|nr:hypothetical protein [Verrucomicrobiales bacterium]